LHYLPCNELRSLVCHSCGKRFWRPGSVYTSLFESRRHVRESPLNEFFLCLIGIGLAHRFSYCGITDVIQRVDGHLLSLKVRSVFDRTIAIRQDGEKVWRLPCRKVCSSRNSDWQVFIISHDERRYITKSKLEFTAEYTWNDGGSALGTG